MTTDANQSLELSVFIRALSVAGSLALAFLVFFASVFAASRLLGKISLCAVIASTTALPSLAAVPATAPTSRPTQVVANLVAGKPQTIVAYGTSLTAASAWPKQVEAAL